MKMTASPRSRCRSVEQAQHLRLHHHVERGRRLVGDQQPRLARERERDQHALALAAGELVRVVGARAAPAARPARAARRRACDTSRRRAPRACSSIASPIWSPDALHRVERVQRALEDDRQLGPAHRAQPPGLHRRARPRRRAAPRPSPPCPRGSSRSSAPASVDLPQPDSPARPSVSPDVERRGRRRARPGRRPRAAGR